MAHQPKAARNTKEQIAGFRQNMRQVARHLSGLPPLPQEATKPKFVISPAERAERDRRLVQKLTAILGPPIK